MSKETKYIKLFRTIGITGIAYIINYMITLFLTPYITRTIGTESYGFVSLAKNIAQYATYATLALNSLAGRYISVEYHRNNKKTANVFFSSTFYGDLVLGGLITFAGLVLVFFLDSVFHIPAGLVRDVQFLFLFVFFKFFLETVFSVFTVGAYISNKLDVTGVFKCLSYVVEAILLYVLFVNMRPNVAIVGFCLLASSLVILLSDLWITMRYTPDLKVKRQSFRMESVKTLVGGGIWTSFTQVGNFLHSGLDLAICNLMLTPLAMGQLAIAQSIDLIFKSMLTIVVTAFRPNLLKIYANNDRKALIGEFRLAVNISALFSNLAFAGFTSLGLVYYKLWIPEQDISLIYHLTVICVLVEISSGIVNPLFYVYTLTAKKKVSALVTILSGFANVVSMYFLIRYTSLGIYSVVWTTAVIITITNMLIHPLYMAHILEVHFSTFYPFIARNLLSCLLMTIILKAVSRLYLPDRWSTFILCVSGYTILGGIIHFMTVFTREEKAKIKKKFIR